MNALTAVKSCAATRCAYNQNGCTAFAVTIGGPSAKASCGTLLTLDARGGLPVADGRVGACQRLECIHNADLMCTAETIELVGETADCASYQAR